MTRPFRFGLQLGLNEPDRDPVALTEIIDQLHECRERWGISYFAVRDLDSFAPVIDALGTSRD